MRKALKIVKWSAKVIGLLLVIIVLTGLLFRLFSSKPQPEGELVDVGGFNLHINAAGEKGSSPTVVIESGAGLVSEFYYWLEEGLKDSLRVVRYDRAGIGHSDELKTPRDPETVAQELHTLLKKSGESPPYILVGHSIGGPYIRVYAQLYPDEVEALFFIDATHHDHVERYDAPKKSSIRYKVAMKSLGAQTVLADMGILSLYDKVFGYPYYGDGLPDEENKKIKAFLVNGKTARGFKGEMKDYYDAVDRSGKANNFGDTPIRSFTAIKEPTNLTTLENDHPKNETKYIEFEDLSTSGKHIGITGNHGTIVTKKKNAEIICKEILKVSREISITDQRIDK